MPLTRTLYQNQKKGIKSLAENVVHIKQGAPQCPLLEGVFTLEAAVILPMLATFFVTFLFFFRVMQVQLTVESALNRTGRLLAVYAAGDKGNQALEKTGTVVASAFLAKELKEDAVVEAYVKGGFVGVSLLGSSFKEQEIDLCAQCFIKLPVELLGKKTVRLAWHTVCRKWTGFEADSGQETGGVIVYIAENGTVYHRTLDCTHLKLSITSVNKNCLNTLRNENGEIYSACEKCVHTQNLPDVLYLTSQGNRYHVNLNCSGLKRTVRKVLLSEAGGYAPCSRCGGKEGT